MGLCSQCQSNRDLAPIQVRISLYLSFSYFLIDVFHSITILNSLFGFSVFIVIPNVSPLLLKIATAHITILFHFRLGCFVSPTLELHNNSILGWFFQSKFSLWILSLFLQPTKCCKLAFILFSSLFMIFWITMRCHRLLTRYCLICRWKHGWGIRVVGLD